MTDPQPTRYRQRPTECEAIQWTGDNPGDLLDLAGHNFEIIPPADRIDDPDQDAQLLIEASHWVGIKPGDWVLKFDGYFVAKSDTAFRAVWEPAAVPSAPADRAAILREAADAVAALDRRVLGIDADTIRDAWEEGRDEGVELLRRLADEAQQPRRACTDCGHFICDGNGPCGAIVSLSAVSDETRCPCTGPAGTPTAAAPAGTEDEH